MPLVGLLMTACAQNNTTVSTAAQPANLAGLQKVAEAGNPIAANNLGVLYANGTNVPQDFALARKWYEFASEHGNPAGEFNLAIAFQRGQGTPIDLPEALKWLHLAVDHNYAPAKLSLGMLYQNGTGGVQRDESEAARLVGAAANQNFPPAELLMASYYLGGLGVETNDGLAYEWASLAAAKLTGPLADLAKRLRDNAAKGLGNADMTAAQTITASWKPGIELADPFPPGSGPRPPRLRGEGSGFIVGIHGEVATDYHVVPNCKEIRLKNSAGTSDAVTHRIAGDRTSDLALLAGGGFGSRLSIRNSPAGLGEKILTYGYPLGQVLGSSGNLTTGTVSGTTGFQGNAKAFQITAPVQAGSSGGPVVDESGMVLGVVASKLNALAIAAAVGDVSQNVNFAWHAVELQKLLDQSGVAYDHSAKPGTRTTVDLAEELRKATVKVECWR